MDFSAIALQGVEQAQVQLDAAAAGLASAGDAAPTDANLDTVDIASQIVALNSAQAILQISLSALKTSDQIQKTAIDLLA